MSYPSYFNVNSILNALILSVFIGICDIAFLGNSTLAIPLAKFYHIVSMKFAYSQHFKAELTLS